MRACGSGSGGEGRGGRHRVTSVTLSMLGEKPDLVCDRATCSGRRREPKTLNKRSEPPLPPHVAIRRRRRNPVRGAAESSTSAEESRWLAALSEPELVRPPLPSFVMEPSGSGAAEPGEDGRDQEPAHERSYAPSNGAGPAVAETREAPNSSGLECVPQRFFVSSCVVQLAARGRGDA
ncbi:uncharacterized protein LOC123429815 isoform X2 [Hordeum vulgare subsp. vulgare]|uniref:uncharacterized protein LOC123429815 isoform X2 n=1 Tax=Hordeum vulgare subsp. vulgare TaxID=112509 RepID=UPI001D1A46B4|nr:uncharacterized protein LOC123429815 isoform X2 [Hordeum vulgare subsp. vulgare]